jgi:hypothetical protein
MGGGDSLHRSLQDSEVGEFAGEAAPASIDSLDTSGRRALLSPAVEFSNGGFLALDENFHGPIRAVLDPPAQTQPPGFTLGGGAKEDALHASSDNQLQLFQCHDRNEYSETGV